MLVYRFRGLGSSSHQNHCQKKRSQFETENAQFHSFQVPFKTMTPEEFCSDLMRFLDGETKIFCLREAQEEVTPSRIMCLFSFGPSSKGYPAGGPSVDLPVHKSQPVPSQLLSPPSPRPRPPSCALFRSRPLCCRAAVGPRQVGASSWSWWQLLQVPVHPQPPLCLARGTHGQQPVQCCRRQETCFYSFELGKDLFSFSHFPFFLFLFPPGVS